MIVDTEMKNLPIVEVRNARKFYGDVAAVDNVDLVLHPGEIYGLLGENGAGKSTLAKSLAGVVMLSSGEMKIAGAVVHPSSPRQALELGIAMVFQESSLVPTMSVAQNLFLGHERFYNSIRGVELSAQRILQSLNFEVEPSSIVSTLGAAQKQMVEIARAVLHQAKVIIFDEPTTSLTPEEKRHFFKLITKLKVQGVSILFITHALEDALEYCDRITILRDGKHVATDSTGAFDMKSVVSAMIGRDVSQTMYGQKKTRYRAPKERVLSVHNLRMTRGGSASVKNNTFSVSSGQVTGVFGLVGAGRSETFKIVAGLLKRNFVRGGDIVVRGKARNYASPVQAVQDGIAYITEDRKVEGFFETMTSSRNIYAALLAKMGRRRRWLSRQEETLIGDTWIRNLKVKSTHKDAKVVELSGGNQQKIVIARSLVQEPEIVIFDEPTKGVDVGAIAEIHALIARLADEGKAVVVISSYLPEIVALSDRVLVMKAGRVVEELAQSDVSDEKIMYAALH
jgi:ABC-type sugar transport system ATPase subunit